MRIHIDILVLQYLVLYYILYISVYYQNISVHYQKKDYIYNKDYSRRTLLKKFLGAIIEKSMSYAIFVQKNLVPDIRAAAGFIGNLEIGRRYSDETVFHRVMEFENPTKYVQSITLTLTVTNGEEMLTKVCIIYFQLI